MSHLHEAGVPLLQLDGDGIDERNSHDGQIKTRLEAFFEVLEAKRAEGAAQGGNVNGESTAQGGTARDERRCAMRIGYVCKYVPVEALEAMGAHMERIEPDESLVSFDAAESCMHANVCSFAKGDVRDRPFEKP